MQENKLILDQRQTLATGQIQSLEILSYTNQELNYFLTNEYLENPMLESDGGRQDDMLADLEEMYEKGMSYKEHYIAYEEDDCSRSNDIRAREEDGIEDYILGQLCEENYSRDEWKVMGYLVNCLDDKGFFTYETDYIARLSGYPEEMIIKCLEILKGLEPVGVFSGDISECLLKQLEAKGITDEKLLLMVQSCLPEILEGHISVVSRKLKLSTARVREYIHLIGSLNPRPFMNSRIEESQYIVPDILVTFYKGEWNITLNDCWMGKYKLSDFYIGMMQDACDEELKNYFRERLERARFILNCVEQRRSTILKIAEAILDIQKEYFMGTGPLRPMTMEDIAELTQMHVSTVSRAVRDKYIQFQSIVLLRSLFQSRTGSGEDVSADAVVANMRTIIEQEDKEKPFSDQKIAEILKAQGFEVSRRTVAKYRVQMGIPESRQRIYLRK